MKKILSAMVILLLIPVLTPAGEKADFKTAEKFAPENLRKLVGTRNVEPVWIEGTDSFIYKFRQQGKTGCSAFNMRYSRDISWAVFAFLPKGGRLKTSSVSPIFKK